MYLIREVLHCKPGKVRHVLGKFQQISTLMASRGHPPFRLLTDVTGEPFWTVVAETEVGAIDEFFRTERTLMDDESVRQSLSGFHDLVDNGRREIYRIEG